MGVTFINLRSRYSIAYSLNSFRSLGAAGGAADAACQLDEGLKAVIDIDDVTVISNLEPRGSLLLAHMVQHDRIVENNLDRRVHFFNLDRHRHWRRRGCQVVVHVHGVLSSHDAPDTGGLLTDRAIDLAAVHRDRIVETAAIIAIEHHESRFTFMVPHDIAERILDIVVDVIRVAVGPAQRDDEFCLGVDLTLLRLGIHDQQGDEKQERHNLQRLEQHDAERIERSIVRIVTEAFHAALARGRTPRKPRSDWWRARTAAGSPYRACSTASALGLSRSVRSRSYTWRPPCRRSSAPLRCVPIHDRPHQGRQSAPAS